jgi:hypothetical protein
MAVLWSYAACQWLDQALSVDSTSEICEEKAHGLEKLIDI